MFETCGVNNMAQMFMGCVSLQSVPQYNTGNVQNMNDFLNGCMTITTVPQFDTSNVMYADNMFRNCDALTSIPELNFSNLQKVDSDMFYDDNYQWSGAGYPLLTDLGGFLNYGTGTDIYNLNLGHCTALTYDSIMKVFNKLANKSWAALQLPHHAQSLLSENDIMIATNKGWTVNFEPEWVNP